MSNFKKHTFTTAYKFYSYNETNYYHLKKRFLRTFTKIVEQRIPKELSVTLESLEFTLEDAIEVTLKGPNKDDLVFTQSQITPVTGLQQKITDIKVGDVLYGTLKEVGGVGFGLFVDVGLFNPEKDVLLHLHYLRDTLVGGEKMSLHEIAKLYGFVDHFPVEIKIVNIESANTENPKIKGEFAPFSLEQFKFWVQDGFDVLISTGVARQAIKKSLAKRGHTQDLWEVQRLGPLETATICRDRTTAPGLIYSVGKFLPNCKFSALEPKKLKKYWE